MRCQSSSPSYQSGIGVRAIRMTARIAPTNAAAPMTANTFLPRFFFAALTLDKGDHLNLSGAHKVTDYMTMYLQEHYMLPDHRGDEKFTSWDTMASQYTTETGY